MSATDLNSQCAQFKPTQKMKKYKASKSRAQSDNAPAKFLHKKTHTCSQ